ncbi:hypothetical protein [Burkholderia pseudomallei]|uniref:hypothetical protein n=1 Tax=Burkholderia pseudomallei TaxID=28450 RepID=UPI003F65C927
MVAVDSISRASAPGNRRASRRRMRERRGKGLRAQALTRLFGRLSTSLSTRSVENAAPGPAYGRRGATVQRVDTALANRIGSTS